MPEDMLVGPTPRSDVGHVAFSAMWPLFVAPCGATVVMVLGIEHEIAGTSEE